MFYGWTRYDPYLWDRSACEITISQGRSLHEEYQACPNLELEKATGTLSTVACLRSRWMLCTWVTPYIPAARRATVPHSTRHLPLVETMNGVYFSFMNLNVRHSVCGFTCTMLRHAD